MTNRGLASNALFPVIKTQKLYEEVHYYHHSHFMDKETDA